MINRFGQVNILIQAVVSEIYYISNHWNFISNHCTSLHLYTRMLIFSVETSLIISLNLVKSLKIYSEKRINGNDNWGISNFLKNWVLKYHLEFLWKNVWVVAKSWLEFWFFSFQPQNPKRCSPALCVESKLEYQAMSIPVGRGHLWSAKSDSFALCDHPPLSIS